MPDSLQDGGEQLPEHGHYDHSLNRPKTPIFIGSNRPEYEFSKRHRGIAVSILGQRGDTRHILVDCRGNQGPIELDSDSSQQDKNDAPDVVCVGNIVADIVPDPVTRLPASGELTLTGDIRINIGGCGATTAIALTHLGVRTALITSVGHDPLGRHALSELSRKGVATSHVDVSQTTETSKNIILLVEGEDRRYIYSMGATAEVRADSIDPKLTGASRFLFIGAYLLMPNMTQDALVEVFREARRGGVKTVLDVAAVRSGHHRRSMEAILGQTDYFLPNQDEAEIISGQRDPRDQARAFRDMGAETVVITCGGDGATLVNSEGGVHAPAHAGPFIDGTGAGDCFDAAFLAALLSDEPATEALRWGSAMGGACVRSVGGTSNLMTRDQLREYVDVYPLELRTFSP